MITFWGRSKSNILDTKYSQISRNTPWWKSAPYKYSLVFQYNCQMLHTDDKKIVIFHTSQYLFLAVVVDAAFVTLTNLPISLLFFGTHSSSSGNTTTNVFKEIKNRLTDCLRKSPLTIYICLCIMLEFLFHVIHKQTNDNLALRVNKNRLVQKFVVSYLKSKQIENPNGLNKDLRINFFQRNVNG